MENMSSVNDIASELTLIYESFSAYQTQIKWTIRSIVGCLILISLLIGICSSSIMASQNLVFGEFLALSGDVSSNIFSYKILFSLVLFFMLILVIITISLFRKYTQLKANSHQIQAQITAIQKKLLSV